MWQFGSPYTLTEADVPAVHLLFDALQQLSPYKPRRIDTPKLHGDLTVALRRFNQAYSRNISEDQIIDLSIALESSLLADVRDELKYRLALRGAALLADTTPAWEPHQSKALLLTMYDVRSSIVHDGKQLPDLGKEIKKVGVKPQEFAQQCENIVRDILKAYVLRQAKGQSVAQVNQEVESRIVAGLVPQVDPAMEQS